ncbi:hypothetical protein Tco_1221345 [Tanacetum coccineum]
MKITGHGRSVHLRILSYSENLKLGLAIYTGAYFVNLARGIQKLRTGLVQTVAGSGCPSTDRKVVNSGKRLRAHVGIDEGNVCSSCTLRGNCERAYAKAREDEGGRTIDVMRFVITYGLDHIAGSEGNKAMINKKVEEAIRSLIKDMVKYGKDALDIDPSEQDPSVPKSQSQHQEHRSTFPTLEADWNCPKYFKSCNLCFICHKGGDLNGLIWALFHFELVK